MSYGHREESSRSPARLPTSHSAFSAILLSVGVLASCPALAPHAPANITLVNGSGAPGSRPAQRIGHGITAIGLASDPVTGGYWILKSNGGVVGFHAPWRGSMAYKLPAGVSVTAIASSSRGGYLILTSDGQVHNFGTPRYGSDAGHLPAGVAAVGLASDRATGGYWILRSDGVVDNFHAPHRGSLTGGEPAGSTLMNIAAGRTGGYLVLVSSAAMPAGLGGRVWNVIPTKKKIVALTFDVGPHNGLKKTLSVLRRDHVRGTFFLVGGFARKYKAIARSVAAAGEVIGDHSLTHPHFTRITDTSMRYQVLGAGTQIESVTQADPWPWFRFPYGDYNGQAVRVLNSIGFVPIGWTVDTLGWMGTSQGITVQTVVDRVLASLQPGEIVLMHGGTDTGDGSHVDADALPTVIRDIRGYGYNFVTINALRKPGIRSSAGLVRVRDFGTPWHGSPHRLPPQVFAVSMAVDPATLGYWIVTSDGALHNFHAPWRGSLRGKIPPGSVITAIAAGMKGGYLILTSNGDVHAFGTPWYGSLTG
jgi:peptidoglycan/xylan/chitin deacetylase (PgdA/CDA1 family)